MQALGRYSIALAESLQDVAALLVCIAGGKFAQGASVSRSYLKYNMPLARSHVDIPLRYGRRFDEVTSACKKLSEVQHDICPS